MTPTALVSDSSTDASFDGRIEITTTVELVLDVQSSVCVECTGPSRVILPSRLNVRHLNVR